MSPQGIGAHLEATRHEVDKATTGEPDCTCPSDQPMHEDACPQRQYFLAQRWRYEHTGDDVIRRLLDAFAPLDADGHRRTAFRDGEVVDDIIAEALHG